MKKGLLIILIAAVLIALFVLMLNNGDDAEETENDANEIIKDEAPNVIVPAQEEAKMHTISIVATGYAPNSLEIKKGDSVVFMNNDAKEHWPASNSHPTHRIYPGSDISKCGTAEEVNIFDACKGLKERENYKFTFNEAGTWKYHDHLMAGI